CVLLRLPNLVPPPIRGVISQVPFFTGTRDPTASAFFLSLSDFPSDATSCANASDASSKNEMRRAAVRRTMRGFSRVGIELKTELDGAMNLSGHAESAQKKKPQTHLRPSKTEC